MSVSGEPENYSIDDMMERLQSQPETEVASGGKLVTRADGSQAIRVKKRKRRSHQPHKEKEQRKVRRQIIQLCALVIGSLLLVAGAAAALLYSNTPGFQLSLKKKISAATGAESELHQFSMNPSGANAQLLALSWPAGNILNRLELRQLSGRTHLSSFAGTFGGDELMVREGLLNLQAPADDQPVHAGNLFSRKLPVRFQRISVSKMNVIFGADGEAPVAHLTDTQASFYPKNDSAQVRLTRGTLSMQGWPDLRVERGFFEFHGSQGRLGSLRVLSEKDDRGALEFSGNLDLFEPAGDIVLDVEAENFPITDLTGAAFGQLISGRVESGKDESGNTLAWSYRRPEEMRFGMAFRKTSLGGMEILNFPFLNGLAKTIADEWYQRPYFESMATGRVERTADEVRLTNLHFQARQLAVKGELRLDKEHRLSGKLQVGVPDAMISSSPVERVDRIFGPASDGYRWVELEMGGTSSSPQDNFQALFSEAPQRRITPPSGLPTGGSFEELTR